ncbi:4109_t:CDS:2 [Diversispora eburnea]|uniref:4109_t:CDS:1 n=1 Tax=Diversispora eburnea TaxID=1213867 RepID=A0A9N8YMF5_9GLOM|nr:4109_t:CDS:2 [Diversispora eburnea]
MSPAHNFEEKTFTKFTYCVHCRSPLWGLFKQGVCCKECNYVAHKQCQNLVKSTCKNPGINQKFNISHYTNGIDNDKGTNSETSQVSSSLPITGLKSSNNSVEIATNSLPARAVKFNSENDDHNRNILRRSNSFENDDHNINILRRSNSFDSISTNLPKMPIQSFKTLSNDNESITPRAARPVSPISLDAKTFQDLIVSSALNVANATKMTTDPAHPPLNLQLMGTNFGRFVQKCGFIFAIQDNVEEIIMWKSPSNTLLAMVIYVYILDYLKNIQNIQNLMGLICEAYDSIVPLLKHIDWSNEYESFIITQVIVILIIILGLTVWIIPWSYIFIVIGLLVFIANTQFMKALTKEMKDSNIGVGTSNSSKF